jgi:hypothetical protein
MISSLGFWILYIHVAASDNNAPFYHPLCWLDGGIIVRVKHLFLGCSASDLT